ncbi:MAG TPA: hypothetical protein PLC81_02525, partial [Bacteroidales bacterium]|nr:hypothetical protein [Bacteroidales bacterium]
MHVLDRLIETKDPNGNTITTTYDIFSRPVETRNKATNQWLTKTYYDSYTINGIAYDQITSPNDLRFSNVYNENTKVTLVAGKETVTMTRILDPLNGMKDTLITVNYYDKYGKIIQIVSQNHKGGVDRISYRYKYINSNLIEQKNHQHGINGSTITQTVIESNTYDHNGRLLTTKHKINSNAEVILSALSYNEVSQMNRKNLNNIQELSFGYNIRGWLTRINDPDATNTNRLFNLKLDYVYYRNSNNITFVTWYNGDNMGINKKKKYFLTYDALNRLTKATYYETNEDSKYNESITYDVNGNIRTAKRYGLLQDGSNLVGLIDDITYTYYNNNKSNRLMDADDNAPDVSGRGDFSEEILGQSSQEYLYDNNGNMISDANKLISIAYNHLNLPKSTYQYGGSSTKHAYKATGERIGSEF